MECNHIMNSAFTTGKTAFLLKSVNSVFTKNIKSKGEQKNIFLIIINKLKSSNYLNLIGITWVGTYVL